MTTEESMQNVSNPFEKPDTSFASNAFLYNPTGALPQTSGASVTSSQLKNKAILPNATQSQGSVM